MSTVRDSSEEAGSHGRRSAIDWAGFGELWGRQRDQLRTPAATGLTIGAVVAWSLALFVIYLAWNGAAERSDLALQVPYLISGGLTVGLLTMIGAALFLAGAVRRLAEDEDEPAPGPPDTAAGSPR